MTIPVNSQFRVRKIAVFGLGKLGACLAATFASRGFDVAAFDIDRSKTDTLARGVSPVDEPMLQETITKASHRLRVSHNAEDAISNSDASFFIPATPSLPDGSFDNKYLLKAIESAAKAVRQQKKPFHLFVINSTVTPGTLDGVIKPMIEDILMSTAGERFGLCYNPEFIALGDVIHGLLEPDFVLIGQTDDAAGAVIENVYRTFCTNSPAIERMSNINAELAKISVNCAVTTKISFVNQLSAVCAQIPGADPGVILRSIGKDRRIGADYLKPGLGFGGPCFPRDNELFQYVARSVGARAVLAEATVEVNESVNRRLLATVLAHSTDGRPVGVCGLAYKPFTGVIDCSPGMWLCRELLAQERSVVAHDYMASANAMSRFTDHRIHFCDDPKELLKSQCGTLAITCPWPAYREFFISSDVASLSNGLAVIDPWRLLEGVAGGLKNCHYITNLHGFTVPVSKVVAYT